jgi:hypothetical protein
VSPNSKFALVARPFGFAVPFKIASEDVIPVASPVTAVGGMRPSSFRIVPTPCAFEIDAPVGWDRLTKNVSSGSVRLSPLT